MARLAPRPHAVPRLHSKATAAPQPVLLPPPVNATSTLRASFRFRASPDPAQEEPPLVPKLKMPAKETMTMRNVIVDSGTTLLTFPSMVYAYLREKLPDGQCKDVATDIGTYADLV